MTLQVFANAAQVAQIATLPTAILAQQGTQYTAFPAKKTFAACCNHAAEQSAADWLLFLAPCVQVDDRLSAAIAALHAAITKANATSNLSVFELRQLPLEAGHHFDPITLSTQTIEPEAFAVRRTAYQEIGGLDPAYDLHLGYEFSLRMRAAGHTLQYLPTACVTVQSHDRLAQPTLQDYLASLSENLLLSAKYHGPASITRAKFDFFAAIKQPKHYPSVRKKLIFALPSLMIPGFQQWFWRHSKLGRTIFATARDLHTTCPPSAIPQRGRAMQPPLGETPLVSVVVRTCGRPAVLAETLKSLRHQTYPNFEIVIIEDGAPTAQETVSTQFVDLPIRYHATEQNVGRGRAGNLGIEHAHGEYVCFLDDDDFHYPDYIEASVAVLQSAPDLDVVYTPIMALEMDVQHRTPTYEYTIIKTHPILFDHLTLMDMCVKCRVPMSGGMFRRSLYHEVGGMREDLDADEDWAMWLRYSMVGRRKNKNGLDILRAESLCAFPADPALAAARHEAYEKFDFTMLSDPDLKFTVTTQDLTDWKEQVLRDVAHLKALGTLDTLLQGREAWPRYAPTLAEGNNEIVLTALQINGYYQTILDDVSKLT